MNTEEQIEFDDVLREIEVGVDISEGNYDILRYYRDEYKDLLAEVKRLREENDFLREEVKSNDAGIKAIDGLLRAVGDRNEKVKRLRDALEFAIRELIKIRMEITVHDINKTTYILDGIQEFLESEEE